MEQEEVSSQDSDDLVRWVEDPEPVKEWPIEGIDREIPQADTGRIGSNFFANPNNNEDWKETKIGTMPNGNSFYVTKKLDGHGYVIVQKPGANPPKELQGTYTSYFVAEREARTYLSKKIDEHNAQISTN